MRSRRGKEGGKGMAEVQTGLIVYWALLAGQLSLEGLRDARRPTCLCHLRRLRRPVDGSRRNAAEGSKPAKPDGLL